MEICTYKKVKQTTYEDTWKSSCGYKVVCKLPIEIGPCFAPEPDYKFCPKCGNRVELKGIR